MSQSSSKYDMDNYNYADTLKQEREITSSTPNVFNQNLGSYPNFNNENLYNNYNNYTENYNSSDNDNERREDYIKEIVNEEEIKVSEKDLEIFEDKNNHIEEINEVEVEMMENMDNEENNEINDNI
jgi:hypothetical protein